MKRIDDALLAIYLQDNLVAIILKQTIEILDLDTLDIVSKFKMESDKAKLIALENVQETQVEGEYLVNIRGYGNILCSIGLKQTDGGL